MAGKAINQYNEYTGQPSGVNILVQEQSQSEPNTFEHKKADLDALLNKKIVQTITDNDTTHVPSADAVYDALLTESTARANADTTLGQNITAEATARANADTTLGQRINANSKRITNLEQKAGDEIVVDYPSSTYGMDEVPANVAEYAKVTKLRGVSRVWNQLVKNYNLAQSSNDWTLTNCTWSSGKLVSNGSSPLIYQRLPTIYSGHRYLIKFRLKSSIATTKTRVQVYAPSPVSSYLYLELNQSLSADTWKEFIGYTTASATSSSFYAYVYHTEEAIPQGETLEVEIVLRDITQYFGGTIPSDADTIAKIQQNYPELLTPSEYGVRIVDSSYSGVRAWGVNLIDASNLIADSYVESLTGIFKVYSGVKRTDYMRVKGGESYFFGGYIMANKGNTGAYFDINKNFLGAILNDSDARPFVAPANCAYVVMNFWLTNWGDLATTAYFVPYDSPHAWSAYMENTLSLTFQGKSAGSVHDELDVETGVVTRKIGSVDLGTLDWSYYSTGGITHFYSDTLTDIKKGSDNNYVMNAITPLYQCVSITVMNTETIPKTIAISSDGYLCIDDDAYTDAPTFKTAMSGVYLYYELATPTTEQTTPVLDPFIQVEGGGTIRPIQTQTTEIDSAMTAEYLAV